MGITMLYMLQNESRFDIIFTSQFTLVPPEQSYQAIELSLPRLVSGSPRRWAAKQQGSKPPGTVCGAAQLPQSLQRQGQGLPLLCNALQAAAVRAVDKEAVQLVGPLVLVTTGRLHVHIRHEHAQPCPATNTYVNILRDDKIKQASYTHMP